MRRNQNRNSPTFIDKSINFDYIPCNLEITNKGSGSYLVMKEGELLCKTTRSVHARLVFQTYVGKAEVWMDEIEPILLAKKHIKYTANLDELLALDQINRFSVLMLESGNILQKSSLRDRNISTIMLKTAIDLKVIHPQNAFSTLIKCPHNLGRLTTTGALADFMSRKRLSDSDPGGVWSFTFDHNYLKSLAFQIGISTCSVTSLSTQMILDKIGQVNSLH